MQQRVLRERTHDQQRDAAESPSPPSNAPPSLARGAGGGVKRGERVGERGADREFRSVAYSSAPTAFSTACTSPPLVRISATASMSR